LSLQGETRMILLNGYDLTLGEVVKVAREYEEVQLSEAGMSQLAASRAIVDKVLDEENPVYGISTGFCSGISFSVMLPE